MNEVQRTSSTLKTAATLFLLARRGMLAQWLATSSRLWRYSERYKEEWEAKDHHWGGMHNKKCKQFFRVSVNLPYFPQWEHSREVPPWTKIRRIFFFLEMCILRFCVVTPFTWQARTHIYIEVHTCGRTSHCFRVLLRCANTENKQTKKIM